MRPLRRRLLALVPQSVANTLKRALLIWLSVLYFGNAVTWLSALGTGVCICGVFAYNHARRVYPYVMPPLLRNVRPSMAAFAEKSWPAYQVAVKYELIDAPSADSARGDAAVAPPTALRQPAAQEVAPSPHRFAL